VRRLGGAPTAPFYASSMNKSKMGVPMAKKQSSSKTSTLASKVLSGAKKPTTADAKKLAASVLSQDEKKGNK
jgi:hypothetical protein